MTTPKTVRLMFPVGTPVHIKQRQSIQAMVVGVYMTAESTLYDVQWFTETNQYQREYFSEDKLKGI